MPSYAEAKPILGEEFCFITDFLDEIIREVTLPSGAKILDVGTGIGRMAVVLALNGYQVITGEPADDNSEYAKKEWRENAMKAGVADQIEFKPFEAESLPFADGEFAAVFVMGTFHHVADQAAAIREFCRVTSPGGVVCIIEPTEAGIARIKEKSPQHPDREDPEKYIGKLPLKLQRQKPHEQFSAYIFNRIAY